MNRKRLWFAAAIVFILFLAVYFFRPQILELDWDRSPDNRFIFLDMGCCREISYNYIPDFQVWGDGRIIWVEYGQKNSRRVLEGHLSETQLKDLLTKFSKAGFFDFFVNDKDYAIDSVRIKLRNVESSRYILPEDSQVFDLANYLRKGAGAVGSDYVPLRADLYVFPASEIKDLPKDAKAQYKWPDGEFGYTLASAPASLAGNELAFAWKVVNGPEPLVESGGVTYWVGVDIPGVSP